MHIHYIELPKFDDNKEVELMSDLEEWVTFIKDYGKEDKIGTIDIIASRKESIHMAKELADKLPQDEIEYQRYLAREKAIMDESSKREYSKMQLEEMKKREQKALEAEQKALEAKQKALEAKESMEKEKNEVVNAARLLLKTLIGYKFIRVNDSINNKINILTGDKLNTVLSKFDDISTLEELEELLS